MRIYKPEICLNQRGKHAYIYRGKFLDELKKDFKRDNVCLKIFYGNSQKKPDMKEYLWGDNPKKDEPQRNTKLLESTKIKNIFHYEGFAPRVYALFFIDTTGWPDSSNDGFMAAQLVEDIEGKYDDFSRDKIRKAYRSLEEVGLRYDITSCQPVPQRSDFINGKFVDFQTFRLGENYLNIIKAIYAGNTRWGTHYYQKIKKFGLLDAPRDMENRVDKMELDKVDFNRKSVLDIGCSGGAFCNYAEQQGANRILGLDYPKVIEGARLMSNELEYFNVDYKGMDLAKERINEKFDIVFFLSLDFHIGIPNWLADVTNELCIFEINAKGFKDNPSIVKGTEDKLKSMFREVKLIGKAEDQGDCQKPIYYCYK